MRVWVVSHVVSNEGGNVMGVAGELEAAKRLADEEKSDWGDGRDHLDWVEKGDGTWAADASAIAWFEAQRFDVM